MQSGEVIWTRCLVYRLVRGKVLGVCGHDVDIVLMSSFD